MARRFSIKFKTGTCAGQGYSVGTGEYLFIGSGENCAIRITDDPTVSPTHACIYYDPSGLIRFKDMGSQFGTFKNGKKITSAVLLKPGDRVTLGQISTFQSSWWNALQVTLMTRFSRIPSRIGVARDEGSAFLPSYYRVAIFGGLGFCLLVGGALLLRGSYLFPSSGAGSAEHVPSPGTAGTLAQNPAQGDLGIFSGALSAKLFSSKPKRAAKVRVEITPERRFIWDEIVAISRRFGDPPPSAMDPGFIREVERHINRFTRGGYHRQILARKMRFGR